MGQSINSRLSGRYNECKIIIFKFIDITIYKMDNSESKGPLTSIRHYDLYLKFDQLDSIDMYIV